MSEQRKRDLMILMPVLVCFLGIAAVSIFWLKEYRESSLEQISTFCEVLMERNPEAEEQILAALKEYRTVAEDGMDGNMFLEQYGYESNQFAGELAGRFFLLLTGVFLVTAGCFFICFRRMERRKNVRIAELTGYLEQVNTGAGGTVLQICEDEFSRLQDELYKTVTELCRTKDAALKAKENFADHLANIAHQLKTPVTAASLSLQLLEKEAPGCRVDQVKRQLERLETLEETLLTLSRIDAGVLPLEHGKVDVYTALTLAADNLDDLLRKERISVSIPDQGCVEIVGDMEWTMEALMNLMKNCMEHSPRGGTVHCDYSANPIYAEILIWDEGEGFCQEDIPYLFERFYRGKRACPHGAGIGLALAKSVFELQNGNVTARNLPDGGACFEIRVYSH